MISNNIKQNGFTLLELMVVVVIVGILTALVLPSYTESIRKARRSDAMSALMDAANRQEQLMLDRNSYTVTIGDLRMANPTPEEHYNISVLTPTAACPITRCYVLRATPEATSPQVDDAKCASFTLTSRGTKTALRADNTQNPQCWGL